MRKLRFALAYGEFGENELFGWYFTRDLHSLHGIVIEVAKHELTVSTPEASSCVTGCKATSGAVTPKASD